MRILEINSVLRGSTGKIAIQIGELAQNQGHEVCICVPKGRHNKENDSHSIFLFGNRLSEDSHLVLSRLTGLNGYFSVFATNQLIKKIDNYHPDIIQLHNLHNSYINVPILFSYIKKRNIPIVWTLHDCWAFTGKCPYFTDIGCNKWKTGCHSCAQFRKYPRANIDMTQFLWKDKKKLFLGVNGLTIVTPSQWLKNLVMNSFLNQYPVKVINNGIDLSVFKPTDNIFRQKYSLNNKKIVLGVASVWERRKGLDVFCKLARDLTEDYQIVLVGIDPIARTDIPSNIIGIKKTDNQTQLADIYSSADVFVNPTLEDNFPTVNLEALACGTPVITYDTGGSAEPIDSKCGIVVSRNDYSSLKAAVVFTIENRAFLQENCLMKAKEYSAENKFEEYIKLYENCSRNTKCSI